MDYAFLRQEAIKHLEKLVGAVWTDYNSHDPGITILEQICFALTDLGYRINYSMPDLLANGNQTYADTLFKIKQILPSNPVTLLDWRKLAIDVPGVNNAWVENADISFVNDKINHTLNLKEEDVIGLPITLKGLHRVYLDIPRFATSSTRSESAIVTNVRRRLLANRGLGEDFLEIRAIPTQEVGIQATIEIDSVENSDAIMLEILQRIAQHISPSVQFLTLNQLLQKGQSIDNIFSGPLLTHGFIDTEELKQAQRRTELRASDLIQEIMDAAGVKAVRTISMSKILGVDEPWLLPLDRDSAPRFKPPTDVDTNNNNPSNTLNTKIILQRNGLPVRVNLDKVLDQFKQWQRDSVIRKPLSAIDKEPDLPIGQERHLSSYLSIQHHFPATYGIGTLGLPASASAQRKAQTKQLQAYLLFFDQLLANYFAQLAHIDHLFSPAPPVSQTYFSQLINDPALNIDEILPITAEELQNITEPQHSERRNRFLNHLLARFAEKFTDYALILHKNMANNSSEQSTTEKVINDKEAFLQAYPVISQAKGTGFNYLLPRTAENQSGLEKRLRFKLGLTEPEDQFLIIEHILLRPISEDDAQSVPILQGDEEIPLPVDPYSLQLTFILPKDSDRYANPEFKTFVERTIREETPAHLTYTIQWLESSDMNNVKSAYTNWLEKLRLYANQPGA